MALAGNDTARIVCADFDAASKATQDAAEAVNKKTQADYETATNHGIRQRSGLP